MHVSLCIRESCWLLLNRLAVVFFAPPLHFAIVTLCFASAKMMGRGWRGEANGRPETARRPGLAAKNRMASYYPSPPPSTRALYDLCTMHLPVL